MKLISCLLCLAIVIHEGFTVRNFKPCPRVGLKLGKVRYMQRGRFVKFKCNTGYTMAGEKYSTCVLGAWDNPVPKCVRPTCRAVKPPPNGMIFKSHSGGVLNFFCQPGHTLKGPSISYCDGKLWSTNSPVCIPSNNTPALSCDFETPDICGWTHDFNNDFDWTRYSNSTPSGTIGTGPKYDHTKGESKEGYYMYIESSTKNPFDAARLISPLYAKPTSDTCFEFYYHMYGATIGELRVYVKPESKKILLYEENAKFLKKGNQGDHWYRGLFELGDIDEDFQILIEGIRGTGYVSDIAIDDVKLIPDCSPDEATTISSSTTESGSTAEPLVLESCQDRCVTFYEIVEPLHPNVINCDCDDNCLWRGTCCADYFDMCIYSDLGTTDYDYNNPSTVTTGEDFMSESESIADGYTTEFVDEKITSSSSTGAVSTSTSTTPRWYWDDFTTDFTEKETSSAPVTVSITLRSYTKTQKTTKSTTLTPSKPKTNPSTTVGSIEIETPAPTTIKPKPRPTKDKIRKEIEDETNGNFFKENGERVVVKNTQAGNRTLILAVIAVLILAIAGALVTIVLKRSHLRYRIKRMTGSGANGESQSDVRFLTSDEFLDFRLAEE